MTAASADPENKIGDYTVKLICPSDRGSEGLRVLSGGYVSVLTGRERDL